MIDPLKKLEDLENCYNESSQFYKFSFTFQNLSSEQGSLHSSKTYPIVLKGYDDLKKRTEQQKTVIDKIDGSLDALADKLEKNVAKGKALELKMNSILAKIRNSDIRALYLSKKNINFDPNISLSIKELELYQAPVDLIKILTKMRKVLFNLSQAIEAEKNNKHVL